MKGPYIIPGRRIDLREVRLSDAGERYLSWLNDAEVSRFLESRFARHTLEDLKLYIAAAAESPDSILLAIVLKDDGSHIGNLKIGPINRDHRFASVGLLIGEKSCWGKGYATEAISLATRFAFDTLGLHRLEAGAYSLNEASTKAFLKAGWTREGSERGKWLFDGRYVDGDRISCVRAEH